MRKAIWFSLIPAIISIFLYASYINAPFGTYDIWFERIVFGNYEFSELPESLQSIDIPTNLKSYIKYRAQYVGRTPGSVFITYFGFSVLGNDPATWRIFLYVIMFFTYMLVYLILKKLKFENYLIILILLILPALLSRYFIKTISLIYVFSHLFFLIGIYLELINSSEKSFKYWKSILGALFIFLSIFIRELQASAILGFFAIITFWHNSNGIQIHFKFTLKRFLPYLISAVLYLGGYWGIIKYYGKLDFAYANAVSFNLDLNYLKNSIIFILKYIGFSISAYLGLFILLIFLSGFIYLYFVKREKLGDFDKTENFKVFFGLAIIIPSGFLISLLSHSTGSFTIHILASFILFFTFIQYFLTNIKSNLPKIGFIVLFLLFTILRSMEAKQESYNYIANAKSIQAISKFLIEKSADSEIVELKGFNISEAYSLTTDVYVNKKRLIIYSEDTTQSNNPYMNYLRSGIINHQHLNPTITIQKTLFQNYANVQNDNIIIIEDIKNYSLDKHIFLKYNYLHNINPVFELIHKTLFGFSLETAMKNSKITVYYIMRTTRASFCQVNQDIK